MKNKFREKRERIVAVFLLLSICTACGKAQEDHRTVDGEAVQTAETSVIEETETAQTEEKNVAAVEEENKEAKWDVDFEIIREAYHYDEERNDINIYYPQLTGFGDAAREERINALIEEDVKKWIGETNKEGDDSLYCLYLDYEVKFLNDRMISIFYKGWRGYIMQGRARMPGIAIATTIDLEEEKVIALKDVANVSKLGDMLLSDEFENITMWEGIISEFATSTVIYIHDEGLDADLKERHQWYTDGDHFIVVLVDTKYYDYFEYAIDIEKVSHILDETFVKKLQ